MPDSADPTPRPTGASAATTGGSTSSPAASASGAAPAAPGSFRVTNPAWSRTVQLVEALAEAGYAPDASPAQVRAIGELLERAELAVEETVPPGGQPPAASPGMVALAVQVTARDRWGLPGVLTKVASLLADGYRGGAGDHGDPDWPDRYWYELTDRPDPWANLPGADRAFIRAVLHRAEMMSTRDDYAGRCRRLRTLLAEQQR